MLYGESKIIIKLNEIYSNIHYHYISENRKRPPVESRVLGNVSEERLPPNIDLYLRLRDKIIERMRRLYVAVKGMK